VTQGWPQRIVCLTEETTETLYLLGEQDRIAGVSGYTVRPPEARKKPKISAFINAKFDRILDLKPDLVLAFSDLQADITAELVRRGLTVVNFNQRSVEEILQMILALSRLVGAVAKGQALVDKLRRGLDEVAQSAARFRRRPRVFFEEWHEPLISGIRWVDELVELAGGEPLFPDLRRCQGAKDRIVTPEQVALKDPEVVIASWCGRKVNFDAIRARPGWSEVSAIRAGRLFEVKSTYILQPGPAAVTDGVRQIHKILSEVVSGLK
jgi:iron complex transport system substrate-binding protein